MAPEVQEAAHGEKTERSGADPAASRRYSSSAADTTPLLADQSRHPDWYDRGSPDEEPAGEDDRLGASMLHGDGERHGSSRGLGSDALFGPGTMGSAVFNLSNTIIGAGIMGLPATLKIMGIPFGLLTLVLMGLASHYSLGLLLKASTEAGAKSFSELLVTTYGRAGRILLRLSIIINNTGVLIVYLLILGDVLSGSTSSERHYPGLLEQWSGGSFWWTARRVAVPAVTTLFIAPLCALPHIDSLQYSSGLSILLALAFVLITVALTFLALVRGQVDWAVLKWLPLQVESHKDVWVFFSVIPTMATAYTCHYNLHPVIRELSPPREPTMKAAINWTLGLCTSMYCITALCGYMLFGSATYADVLANFSGGVSPLLNDTVRVLYAAHLVLVFPVIHYSLRTTVGYLLFPGTSPLSSDLGKFSVVTAALVGGILTLSLLTPDVQFAFQLVGSAGAATLAFTLPGLVAISPQISNKPLDPGGIWLLGFGLLITCTGLSSNLHDILV